MDRWCGPVRRTAGAALVLAALAGCSGGAAAPNEAPLTRVPSTSGPTAPSPPSGSPGDLSDYTDPGDGCRQIVSAIGYLDEALVPLGNEDYQRFDDEVRSKISALAGTVELEVLDLPDPAVLEQGRRLISLAESAAAPDGTADPRERVRALRELRREAAQMVLLCADAIRPTAAPTS